jgi:hypothetical protein
LRYDDAVLELALIGLQEAPPLMLELFGFLENFSLTSATEDQ